MSCEKIRAFFLPSSLFSAPPPFFNFDTHVTQTFLFTVEEMEEDRRKTMSSLPPYPARLEFD